MGAEASAAPGKAEVGPLRESGQGFFPVAFTEGNGPTDPNGGERCYRPQKLLVFGIGLQTDAHANAV